MAPLTTRTNLLFSSSSPFPLLRSKFLRVFHFSTYLPQQSSRRHEEDSRNVRVSVWWDFENCNLPAGANVLKVASSITNAIRANGINGPIQITAFGDVLELSRSNQEALSSTGINLTHIPHGGKNSADRSLLVDLMYWISQNPPPAHIFLISGDRNFASILHRLRMNNYNVLLASLDPSPSVLCSAASIMWHWHTLVRGEKITGKHFNQPPGSPYFSWYGHYRVPLEDPYSVPEQSASPEAEVSVEPGPDSKVRSVPKECAESGSDFKLRPVPNAVMKQIRHILSSFPKGMAIDDLCLELGKSNINLDKDIYGYKKFSCFLLSMPHILKLQFGSDGKYSVHGVTPSIPEPVISAPHSISAPATKNEMWDSSVTPKLNCPCSSIVKNVDGNSESPFQSHDHNAIGPPTESHKPSLNKKVADMTNALVPDEEQDSASEAGFFQKFWRNLFVDNHNNSEKTAPVAVNSPVSVHSSKSEEKWEESTSPSNPVLSASCASASHESILDNKIIRSFEELGNKFSASLGLFNRIINWRNSRKNKLFCKESFWGDMEVFLTTPKGVGIISQSRNREQLARSLQKEGPLVLRSLGESDVLHLVELLISGKKWLEEDCTSQTSPFKLTGPVKDSSAHASDGLRSSFLGKPSQSDLQEQVQDERKKHQHLSHDSVPPPVINKKHSNKSRNELLSDCQRLVADMLKEHPGGFNMFHFRRQFSKRYGYFLDHQTLGYPQLASLLQRMPGVRIESHNVLPNINFPNNSSLKNSVPSIVEDNAIGKSELSNTSRKDDDLESPWDDLGPVVNSSCETVSDFNRKAKEETGGHNQFDYECSLSDDDFSDSEEEASPMVVSGARGKLEINDDSSLLQILDSWYSSKENDSSKSCSENVNGLVHFSKNGSKTSGSSGAGLKAETSVMNYRRTQKPSKSYSFVSDQVVDNKDELINVILGSLKRSGESRM